MHLCAPIDSEFAIPGEIESGWRNPFNLTSIFPLRLHLARSKWDLLPPALGLDFHSTWIT